MTDADRPIPQPDGETEVLPQVSSGKGLARTQELPVVDDEVAPPPPAPPAATEITRAPVPSPLAEPVEQPSHTEPAPPPPGPDRTRRPGGALVAVVVVLAVVAVLALVHRSGGTTAAGTSSARSSSALSADISSVDPSGGSGFQREGGSSWRTQTYVSADFGHLKAGVGLLLDLGTPRTVTAVTFDAVAAPIAVELKAGDSASASGAGFTTVGADGSASGSTSLSGAKGGKHRYWLVWVTRLAPQDGGFRAVISGVRVSGAAS